VVLIGKIDLQLGPRSFYSPSGASSLKAAAFSLVSPLASSSSPFSALLFSGFSFLLLDFLPSPSYPGGNKHHHQIM
jgi:hypothetical protein